MENKVIISSCKFQGYTYILEKEIINNVSKYFVSVENGKETILLDTYPNSYQEDEETLLKNIDNNAMEYFAIRFMALRHEGQLDRGGLPYYHHPLYVGLHCKNDPVYRCVGFLHDVIEDTDINENELRRYFPPMICYAVDCISKREGEDLQAYYDRMHDSKYACAAKLQDLMHNSNVSRLNESLLTDKECDRVISYMNQFKQLHAYWNNRYRDDL